MASDPAVFLAACKARADAANRTTDHTGELCDTTGEPHLFGGDMECQDCDQFQYESDYAALGAFYAAARTDLPKLVAFAEAVLAACDEWRDENTVYAENLAYEIRAVAAQHLGDQS